MTRQGFVQRLRLIHPALQTALLPSEVIKRSHSSLHVRIGRPLDPSRFDRYRAAREKTWCRVTLDGTFPPAECLQRYAIPAGPRESCDAYCVLYSRKHKPR